MSERKFQLAASQGPTGTGGPAPSADQDSLPEAEAALARLADNYTTWVRTDLDAMQDALDKATADVANGAMHLGDLFDICHNVKAQGSAFGYPLISQVGELLCNFIRDGGPPSENDLKVVQAHVTAMTFIVENRIAGDGGATGRMLVERLAGIITQALTYTESR